jgi:hypothetical protein
LTDHALDLRLAEWQHFYNWHRPHSSLDGKTPTDRCHKLADKTLFWDQVETDYLSKPERLVEQN